MYIDDSIDTMYAIVCLFHCLLLFILICVHYCIGVVAVEINSIMFTLSYIFKET